MKKVQAKPIHTFRNVDLQSLRLFTLRVQRKDVIDVFAKIDCTCDHKVLNKLI